MNQEQLAWARFQSESQQDSQGHNWRAVIKYPRRRKPAATKRGPLGQLLAPKARKQRCPHCGRVIK